MAAARILVINDTQEILQLFQDLLADEGYEVLLSSFAPQSVYEIARLRPDLVILDLIFGSERIGWQVLQAMRMHRPTATIPVIICTAAANQAREMEPQLVSHGALLVLKPFDIDEILLMVRQALELPRTSGPLQDQQEQQAHLREQADHQQGGHRRNERDHDETTSH
ncbi:MAG: response regulator [Ktedonobacterales bacterium]